MIGITVGGSTKNTDNFLARILRGDLYSSLDRHGQRGVDALRAATPRESGATADAWDYEIVDSNGKITLWWRNSNNVNGFNVAIGLQYGHGTGNGGWIEGRDYINPALQGVFDEIANDVWKEVTRA